MFILMLAAIYGIIGELSNPGAVLPGVAGSIALVVALYMAAVFPVNIAGLLLMLLALALFIVDVYASTHGVLTIGGLISLFLGSIMLFSRDPAFQLSLWTILPATILTGLLLLFVIGAGLRAQSLPIKAGIETMIGQSATALTPIDRNSGKVFAEGTYWNAVSESAIPAGQGTEIIGITGLTLTVKPQMSFTRGS
jgi:membrane-bound serine protease (ClpP class)